MEYKYRFEGVTYSRAKISSLSRFAQLKEPVIAFGPGMPSRNVVYAYKNMRAFLAATGEMKLDLVFDKLKKGVAEARKAEKGDHAVLRKLQVALSRRVKKEYEQVAVRTGLAIDSEELFLRATTKAPVLEGPVFDPACLYTGAGFTGSYMCAATPLIGFAGSCSGWSKQRRKRELIFCVAGPVFRLWVGRPAALRQGHGQ